MILMCAVQPAKAGFIIRQHVATEVSVSAGSLSAVTEQEQVAFRKEIPVNKNYSCFNRVSWVGYAALISAIIGLFVPAFSIITILFGILGMTRGCRADRLATLAMIAGIAELVLFLLTNTAVLTL